MAYGLEIDGFAFTYGTTSVIAKGAVTSTFTIQKSDHPDVTQWGAVFIPTGIRNLSSSEVRPQYSQTATTFTITKPTGMAPHNYLIIGR